MYMMMSAMRDEQVITHLLRADPDLIRAAADVASKRTARQIVSDRFSHERGRRAGSCSGTNADVNATGACAGQAPSERGEGLYQATEHGIRRNDPVRVVAGKSTSVAA